MRLFLMLALCLAFWACTPASARGADAFELIRPHGALPDGPDDRRGGRPNNPAAPDAATPDLPPLAGTSPGLIRRVRVPEGAPLVALTFDLCELHTSTSGFDVELVDLLRRMRVPATFFIGGKWMRSHPERMRELLATPWFEIGNHAWTHGNFGIMPPEMAREQALTPQASYAQALAGLRAALRALVGTDAAAHDIPSTMRLFRLPYGRVSQKNLHVLHGLGLRVIQWDVVAETAPDNSAPAVAEAALRQIRPGSIVLLHANRVPVGTAALTRALLEGLRQKELRCVTVSQLLAAGTPEYAQDGYFVTPGDNLKLDRRFGRYGTGKP